MPTAALCGCKLADALGRAATRACQAPTFASWGSSGCPTVPPKSNDVRDRESVADDEALLGEEPIEPGEIVAYGRLQALGGLRHDTHPRLEELEPLREAEAVVEVLGDLELDAPLPHARLGALLGAGADERRPRVLLLEVLEDRDRLPDRAPVVELERR